MASVAPSPHRFSVDEYYRMTEAGLFGADDRLELYGRAGVAEAWLVDLVAGTVDVFSAPGLEGYGEVCRPSGAERLAVAGATMAVDEILD